MWRADGKRRTIYLSTLWEPDWRGSVVKVRVKPMDGASANVARDATVRIERITLAGSIPIYVY